MKNNELNVFLGKKNGLLTKKYFSLKNDIKKVLSSLIDKGITDLGVTYHGRIKSFGKEEKITFDSLHRDENGNIFLMNKSNNIGYLASLLLLDEQMGLIENLLARSFNKTPLTEPKEERTIIIPATEEEKATGVGDEIHIGKHEIIL